jgi:hypothetical protein
MTEVDGRIDKRDSAYCRGMTAAAVILGGIAGIVWIGQGQSMSGEVGKSIEAEQFVLRDSGGKMRGELSTRVDRSPKLWLYDEAGVRRLEVSLLSDGTPGLRLLDRNEQIRATFGVVEGEPSLTLRDRDGRDRVTIILLANGEPSLFLRDKEGRAVWSSPSIPATK